MIDGSFDIGIRIGALADSSLIARRIAPARRVVCASPGYLAEHGEPAHPDELRRHTCLNYGHLDANARWTFSGPDGEVTVAVESALCVNNGDVLCQAAAHGRGIVTLPTFIAGDDLRAGRLVQIMAPWSLTTQDIYVIYPPHRYLSAKVRVFIDFLAERFGDDPYWDKGL
jgi:DNA-binding transcriptional LysR family regulator